MALMLTSTNDERLVSDEVVAALETRIDSAGEAVLLVPSLTQIVEAQRALSQHPRLCLGVDVRTTDRWVKELWEIWGDGRTIADQASLIVLAHEVMRDASAIELGPLSLLPGVVLTLASLVSQAMPWLPVDEGGGLDRERCRKARLTLAETNLCGLAIELSRRLDDFRLVSTSEVKTLLASRIAASKAATPPVVLAGFRQMRRADFEFACAMAVETPVTFVATRVSGPASAQLDALVRRLCEASGAALAAPCGRPEAPVLRSDSLQGLLDALFSAERAPERCAANVEMLLAAGPVAEAEMCARRIDEILERDPDARIVVVTPAVERAWRELAPKFEQRGISARVRMSHPVAEDSHAVAFMGFAAKVAELFELSLTCPETAQGIEGPVVQLPDNMDWWPPREIIDFLFEDMAHLESERAWALDASWRSDRLLTPARVLKCLQQERKVSASVAHATADILRGRLGAAASKLSEPYRKGTGKLDSAGDEAMAVLRTVMKLSRTLRSLGVTFDERDPDARPLSEIIDLLGWAMGGRKIQMHVGVGSDGSACPVELVGIGDAVNLPQGSADVVVVMGLTTQEMGVEGREGLLDALLVSLGVEEEGDSLDEARATFRTLLGVSRDRIVLERCLTDADGKECYPAVMLAELLGTLGIDANVTPSQLDLTHSVRSERQVGENLSRDGMAPRRERTDTPNTTGLLSAHERDLVFVASPGSKAAAHDLPVLSASQIETYLDCPYKWFVRSRLGLSSPDAAHGAAEMGTFAHRVLEECHRELLIRALERESGAKATEQERLALLATVATEPVRHLEGSAITVSNLDEAKSILELEFDLNRERNMRAGKRVVMRPLVPHGSAERAQEVKLKEDLLSTLAYETGILQGFEPRFFEWGFGRHGELVAYAGAYFTGTVDRIDVDARGDAVIIDYKHKSPVGFQKQYDALDKEVLEGSRLPRHVQSLIYAQIVRRAFEGRLRLVGSVYLATRAPHALAGVADANLSDRVFGYLSGVREGSVCVPRDKEGNAGMNALLDSCEELVAQVVSRMRAGDVEAEPVDAHSCMYCPVANCSRRVAR